MAFWQDHFVCAGSAELDLAPGTYPYEINRGPEYLLTAGTVSGATISARTDEPRIGQDRRTPAHA